MALNSYGVLSGSDSAFIGGIEIQLPWMAHWFKDRGYEVSMICWDEGFGAETMVDGIRVVSMCARDQGVFGLRFLYPRWTSLIQALERTRPDVIYYNYADLELGQVVLWAKARNIPVVYSVANDYACREDLPWLKPMRERILYRYGLKNADRIITQTVEEQQGLARSFGRESVIIKMPNPGFPVDDSSRARFEADDIKFLWVGRFTEEKRLEWFLDIAQTLPEYRFDVVGGANRPSEYANRLMARGSTLSNVTFHGKIAHEKMVHYYKQATLLVSTSVSEGFPNVFVEAWSLGLPVVSTVDPDHLIEREKLGGAAGQSKEGVVKEIRRLLVEGTWQEISDSARQYYDEYHRPELVLDAFESEVVSALGELEPSHKDPERPSVALIAQNAYGVLAQHQTGKHVGGIEVQVPLMAKWLSAKGYRIDMIAWDQGYPDGITHDGVTVRSLCKEDGGVPFLRFLHPRWTSLVQALSRADSDICYYNCGDLGLGQVVLWAKLRGRKVLYSVANDIDCVKTLPALKPLRERVLYRYGLMNADSIVCQTRHQQQLLLSEFGLTAKVIRMPSAGFEMAPGRELKTTIDQKHVLWAGRFTPEKRLEMFLELAKQFPQMIFDVLGDYNAPKDIQYANRMKEMAMSIPNVILHGRVAHNQMAAYFNESYILCSTSEYEGFPNVYLEAWSVGVPLITTFDPDGVVSEFGMGRSCENLLQLGESIVELKKAENWMRASDAALSYFDRFHTMQASMDEFEKTFIELSVDS